MKHVFGTLLFYLTAVASKHPTPSRMVLKPFDINEPLVKKEYNPSKSSASTYNPDHDNIYYFFSRSKPTTGFPVLLYNKEMLKQVEFDPQIRTAVLVHGWLGNVTDTVNRVVVPALMKAVDYNVIVVDWGVGAAADYAPAVENVVKSGESVARFIDWLNNETGASCSDYHLIGHSLGGHQVGVIGRNVKCRIDYITSLDPAMPLWVLNPNRFRADDGVYTEVLHTNVGEAGFILPLGKVDFYANNGIRMPGCDGQNCSHDRCVFYFAESITSGGFLGTECVSFLTALLQQCYGNRTLKMGGLKPKHSYTGIYHFKTNAEPPFSQ